MKPNARDHPADAKMDSIFRMDCAAISWPMRWPRSQVGASGCGFRWTRRSPAWSSPNLIPGDCAYDSWQW